MAGKLEKLSIVSFSNPKLTKVNGSFIAMFNPSTFSVNGSNAFDGGKQPGKGKGDQKLSHREPRSLSFELFFDGTAASPSSNFKGSDFATGGEKVSAIDLLNADVVKGVVKGDAVTKIIDAFMNTAYTITGELHRPNFLAIVWGSFYFPCVLESANVTYSLFNSDGKPLRAKIAVSVKEHITDDKLNAILNLQSPDLTQSRTVISGDTLPNLAEKIYRDESLYLELARVNNLHNYRKLVPGQKLIFPPIEKIKGKA